MNVSLEQINVDKPQAVWVHLADYVLCILERMKFGEVRA
jgi:hypothetical protein